MDDARAGQARLVGRDAELLVLEEFLSPDTTAPVLVLTGGPGVGKTALWEAGLRRARERGFRVLAARPSEAAARYAFAALFDLMDGIGDATLDALPGPQRQALESAVLRSAPAAASPEPFATAAGYLMVLRVLASQAPVVLAVDDLQWLDAASADVLAFAAPRCHGQRCRFLVARRPGFPLELERVLEPAGVTRIEVRPLTRSGAHDLLSRLTAAERRVAVLAAGGLSNKDIAKQLFIAVHTVEVHLAHAYAKLGVRSRTQLATQLTGLGSSEDRGFPLWQRPFGPPMVTSATSTEPRAEEGAMRGMRAARRAVLAAGAAAVLAAGIIVGAAGTAAAATGPGAVGFGINYYGELGNGHVGSTASSSVPVQVLNLPASVTQVDANTFTSAALLPNGTVWVWGNVEFGQLGNGTSGLGELSATPQQVPGLTGVVQVALSSNAVFAVRSDGTVWDWGLNAYGNLGDGTTTAHITPQQVPGLSGITQLAAFAQYVLARRSDGTVWAWGDNTDGELGDGTTTAHLSPEQVPGLSGITQVADNLMASFAVRSDGTLFAWGSEANGVLGNGVSTGFTSVPAPVAGLPGITQVSTSGLHTLALTASGTGFVWAWGDNSAGELGDGSTTSRSVPEELKLTGVTQVSAGGENSAAVRSNGTLLTWGNDYFGQLGNGTSGTAVNAVPAQVPGLTGISQVANGGGYNIAVVRAATVPSVIGKTTSAASTTLQAAGLFLGTITDVTDNTCNFIGKVMRQTPAAGTVVSAGTAVAVTVGVRPPTPCP